MSKICQVTGKKLMIGNNVSHSKRRTKRKFYPNLFTKQFYLATEDRWITLKVSASGIRNISKNGLEATLKNAVDKGFIKNY
jgi:large subunit ribosomal protein L28